MQRHKKEEKKERKKEINEMFGSYFQEHFFVLKSTENTKICLAPILCYEKHGKSQNPYFLKNTKMMLSMFSKTIL